MASSEENEPEKDTTKAPELSTKTSTSVRQLTDRFGNTFFFRHCGGFWLPPYSCDPDLDYWRNVQQLRHLEIRDDDVLVCSYPKSGLHWHVAIIRMLQNQSTEHKPYDAFYLHKHRASFLSQQPSPRLLTTHVPFRYLPKQAFEKKIKIVYLNRNPKDVIVSYFSHRASNSGQMHYPGTFEQFYYLLLEVGYHHGHIFDNLLQFQEGQDSMPDVPIYTSMFEDMKTDPAQGVKNLNQYLGTGCSDALCEEIAEACQFRNLQPAKEGDPPGFDENEFKNGTPTFYRKGEVGDWKNWFTVAMNEHFEKQYSRLMAGYRTVYKYQL